MTIPTIHCQACETDIPITHIFAIQNTDVTYDLEETASGFRFVQKDISDLDQCEYGHDIYDNNNRRIGACNDVFSWKDIENAAGKDIWWE